MAVVLADVQPGSRRGASRTITITVKAMPEGFLSTHLVGGVAPGTIVRLAAPQGNFVMPDPAPASVLFITAGSGITPVMSMLRTLARRDQITDVVHLHSAPTESDVMFAAELATMQRSHEGYRLRLRSTRDRGPPRPVPAGRRGARLARAPDLGLWPGGHAQRRRAGVVSARASRAGSIWSASRSSKAAAHGQGGTVEFARSGRRSPWTGRRR